MMNMEVVTRYESKRNQVHLIRLRDNTCNRLAVMKQYVLNDHKLLEAEYKNLQTLKEHGIPVPEVLEKGRDMLILEHIEGVLASELVERLDTGEWIDQLALWMSRLHSLNPGKDSLLKGDVNLRNFILSKGRIYGLDFENLQYGDRRKDLGNICFFILTDKPSFRKEKHIIMRRFLCSYEKLSGVKISDMGAFLRKSKVEAKLRRFRADNGENR